MGTRVFILRSKMNWPGHEADHIPQSNTEIKSE
jgi:hypothetical protein